MIAALLKKRRTLWESLDQVEGARTHAAVLGIADVTDGAKKRAYKRLAMALHPDRHTNPPPPEAVAKRIEAAWKLVTNANDAELGRMGDSAPNTEKQWDAEEKRRRNEKARREKAEEKRAEKRAEAARAGFGVQILHFTFYTEIYTNFT